MQMKAVMVLAMALMKALLLWVAASSASYGHIMSQFCPDRPSYQTTVTSPLQLVKLQMQPGLSPESNQWSGQAE